MSARRFAACQHFSISACCLGSGPDARWDGISADSFRLAVFLDAVVGFGVRSGRANATLDGGENSRTARLAVPAPPYLRNIPFRRPSCARLCMDRDALTTFPWSNRGA